MLSRQNAEIAEFARRAGILMYRRVHPKIEVLLEHPGVPYWRKKGDGAWSIPKGEIVDGENAEVAGLIDFFGCASDIRRQFYVKRVPVSRDNRNVDLFA
jgi:hypothetical protein